MEESKRKSSFLKYFETNLSEGADLNVHAHSQSQQKSTHKYKPILKKATESGRRSVGAPSQVHMANSQSNKHGADSLPSSVQKKRLSWGHAKVTEFYKYDKADSEIKPLHEQLNDYSREPNREVSCRNRRYRNSPAKMMPKHKILDIADQYEVKLQTPERESQQSMEAVRVEDFNDRNEEDGEEEAHGQKPPEEMIELEDVAEDLKPDQMSFSVANNSLVVDEAPVASPEPKQQPMEEAAAPKTIDAEMMEESPVFGQEKSVEPLKALDLQPVVDQVMAEPSSLPNNTTMNTTAVNKPSLTPLLPPKESFQAQPIDNVEMKEEPSKGDLVDEHKKVEPRRLSRSPSRSPVRVPEKSFLTKRLSLQQMPRQLDSIQTLLRRQDHLPKLPEVQVQLTSRLEVIPKQQLLKVLLPQGGYFQNTSQEMKELLDVTGHLGMNLVQLGLQHAQSKVFNYRHADEIHNEYTQVRATLKQHQDQLQSLQSEDNELQRQSRQTAESIEKLQEAHNLMIDWENSDLEGQKLCLLMGELSRLQIKGCDREQKLVKITVQEEVWEEMREQDGGEGANYKALQKCIRNLHMRLNKSGQGTNQIGENGIAVSKPTSLIVQQTKVLTEILEDQIEFLRTVTVVQMGAAFVSCKVLSQKGEKIYLLDFECDLDQQKIVIGSIHRQPDLTIEVVQPQQEDQELRQKFVELLESWEPLELSLVEQLDLLCEI